MSLYCECSVDDGCYPDYYRENRPKARKEHTCGDCDGTIKKGEKYLLVNGCWEGSPSTYKRCADCDVIRCDFGQAADGCECIPFDSLRGTLRSACFHSTPEEVRELLFPILAAFNAASKERGGKLIPIPTDDELSEQ